MIYLVKIVCPSCEMKIEVGHEHQVKPGMIVGAIANEAGLESQYMGRINIYDDYSTIDLPDEMPKEIFQHLKKVRVQGQQLRITRDGDSPDRAQSKSGKGRKPSKGPSKGTGKSAGKPSGKGSAKPRRKASDKPRKKPRK